ncbi:abortive infection family protein [Candidatus Gracilibacteria bacterium]|nr:abortive infection family protein [Candidatus Gracilibacteria bacterium]
MDNTISPKYQMKLTEVLEKAIWDEFSSYKNVEFYLDKWYEYDGSFWENFKIYHKESGEVDLLPTLHGIDGELLLKIAIDMGVETPDFIPIIPTFKNDLKVDYKKAFEVFQKALKQVEENPDLAIGLVNATLESIIKHILKSPEIKTKYNIKKTLYDLTGKLLKEFKMFPNSEQTQEEVRNIGSSLMKVSKNIEKLRSDKTFLHGKTDGDYVVDDPLYAYFVINAVSTVGLFLISFYNKKFKKIIETEKKQKTEEVSAEDLPF